jgi:Xaa-Pro dipeptidase
LKRDESIVIDTGCTFSGYYADITRAFIIGKDKEFQKLYEDVLTSQEKAIKLCTKGATVGSIDGAARNHLKERGLDRFFIHRTGHGLGLEVHEAPYIVPGGDEVIRPGMVFTIEPGVYLPGKMGLRIEDDVLTTTGKCRNLTTSLPKEFGWWS